MNLPRIAAPARTLALALALASLTLASCTLHVNTAKQASLQTGSPLSSIKPLKVSVGPFEDARGVAPDYAGQVGVKHVKLDKPAAVLVQNSIRQEFVRNGHIALEPGREREADIVVTGTVYRYSLDQQTGFVTIKVMGNVGVKISIKAPSRPTDLFAKKYDGTYDASGMGVSFGAAIKVLDEARLSMLKEFSSDPDLVDFLKRIALGSGGK